MLYAGAQATPDVGASSVLGGSTAGGGFRAAEAHANGRSSGHSTHHVLAPAVSSGPSYYDSLDYNDDYNAIQKIPSSTSGYNVRYRLPVNTFTNNWWG